GERLQGRESRRAGPGRREDGAGSGGRAPREGSRRGGRRRRGAVALGRQPQTARRQDGERRSGSGGRALERQGL
ncbi:MAG: hypothetical protein AVDCRST_MAG04-2426, partial [uncultured Acetobacteraceae bacterium]